MRIVVVAMRTRAAFDIFFLLSFFSLLFFSLSFFSLSFFFAFFSRRAASHFLYNALLLVMKADADMVYGIKNVCIVPSHKFFAPRDYILHSFLGIFAQRNVMS